MIPDTLGCTECSGVAHRVGYPAPEEESAEDQVIAYTCQDCGHRMDVVIEPEPDGEQPG